MHMMTCNPHTPLGGDGPQILGALSANHLELPQMQKAVVPESMSFSRLVHTE